MKIYDVVFGASLLAAMVTGGLLTFANSFITEISSPKSKYLFILFGMLIIEISIMVFVYCKYMKTD